MARKVPRTTFFTSSIGLARRRSGPGAWMNLVTNAWNVKAFIRNFAVVPLYHDFVDPSFHFLDRFEARDESCHASLIHFLVPTSGGDASHLKDGADVAM